jgi:enoyl-CoA hydratase
LDYETLTYDHDDHVVTITYNRPDQHNAVDRTMNRELHHAWQRFRDDDEAFVLIITGAGDTTFCAGWDLADAASMTEAPDYEFFRRHLYNSPGECGYTRRVDIFKPVIAAVNGYAFAAGLETALLADIRIASRGAVFGALERRWNIVAGDGLTVRLPLTVGYAKAMELIITGRAVDADEALRIGLVNGVFEPEELMEKTLEVARTIASKGPLAVAAAKVAVNHALQGDHAENLEAEADSFGELFSSDDAKEGMTAFVEKRAPDFTGR